MEDIVKLTKAQRETLAEISRDPGARASYYPPIGKLVAYGYIKERTTGYGSHVYEITDAGLQALEQS